MSFLMEKCSWCDTFVCVDEEDDLTEGMMMQLLREGMEEHIRLTHQVRQDNTVSLSLFLFRNTHTNTNPNTNTNTSTNTNNDTGAPG